MTLKEFRMRKCMTQAEFAHKTSLSRMTICRLERGVRNPSIPVMSKIARAFGISSNDIFELFYGDDSTFKEGGLENEQRTETSEAES